MLRRAELPQLGHSWTDDGRPITASDVQHAIYVTAVRVPALDLIDPPDRPGPSDPRPAACCLLPGATLRTDVWTSDTG